ncbi:EscC/YscC/HrcC family type III secretion system outer membrane ring protein [Pandoraea sp. XJJ-1]|uniref:EscC/YscC/HrcC family type III secretion system outer membrane ring protein n=1 Tax=Pandoraea sp. XJJ-1 TaxID=3002643 RepID=UPI00227E9B56|nr:EscC/YscC/HrcC family type III secretion system outer membrane ring protein [Pandoraea sp. XJJ-1]WAL83650.1 EscC/YscC/HrcC family type III secretion system outer membrane ring protein [Pandoraea sp. XJJ-1]
MPPSFTSRTVALLAGSLCVTLATASFAAPLTAHAPRVSPGTPVWRGGPFVFQSAGTPLAELLRDFGAHHGIPTVVSPHVADRFIGTLPAGAAQATLDALSERYRLSWYFNGQTLNVYKSSEATRRVMSVRYASPNDLLGHLRNAGVLHPRHCVARAIPATHALEIAGVPACIETVAMLADHLERDARDQQESEETIKIFPLKFATADDTRYFYRGQEVVVPGVVSVLKDLILGAGPLGATATASASPGASAGAGLDARLPPATGSRSGTPRFSADPRRNAVIVRERRRNLPIYGDLIAQLDIRPRLVDISVAIIDVNASDIAELGVDFSGSARLGGFGAVSLNSQTQSGDSGTFTTLVGDTNKFMVNLSALERNSKARVLSRPSIVTLDNMQAVLDRSVTFYTKVSGEKVAKLESVTSGSLLRVTPRLVPQEGDGREQVMLTLNIEDGGEVRSERNSRNEVPTIRNSSISTHATLQAGQSLLLGGFVQDAQHEQERKIPLLGDLPLIGRLFSSTSNRSDSVMRLFLIKAEPAADLPSA